MSIFEKDGAFKYSDRHAWANSVDPESSIFDIYPAIFTHKNWYTYLD